MLRRKGRRKQDTSTALTGQCDHDISGKTFRLLLRYLYLSKNDGNLIPGGKKRCKVFTRGGLKGDESILCISICINT